MFGFCNFDEGLVVPFPFRFISAGSRGSAEKKICVSLFVERLFFGQVLCTVIVYLVGVEVVGVLVE